MANGIIGFSGHDDIDYSRLNLYNECYSPEMQSYLNLMEMEQMTPSITEDGIQITLADLLNRSQMYEEHLANYSGGITENRAYEQYYKLVNAAITGGYDGQDDSTYYYRNMDSDGQVDGHAYDAYSRYLEDQGTGYTADIVRDYMNILENNNNEFGDDVKSFFSNLDDRIRGIRE